MKVIIFFSILCSIFTRIKAPFSPPDGEFLGQYPIRISFSTPISNYSITFRGNPSIENSSRGRRIQPNYELERLRGNIETINYQFTPIFEQPRPRPARFEPPEPVRSSPIFRRSDSPYPPASPISRPIPPPRFSSVPSYSPPSTPSNSGNSYWNPVQCDTGICARRREFRSNFNLNQDTGPFPRSNSASRSRVSIPITGESTGPTVKPSVEPNRPNDSTAKPLKSTINPPATSNNLNTSSPNPPVGPDQPSNPSVSPDPPKDVSKDEEIKPPNDEKNDSKKPEENPQPKSSDESSKKQPNGEELQGPKTPEDKPENYTKAENIIFIQTFTSDMTRLQKYKIAKTIRYLLAQKKDELNEYDKAVIRYVLYDRLKKDPEIKEAEKKYNEIYKNLNVMLPSPSNALPSDQEIPRNTPQTPFSSNSSFLTQMPFPLTFPLFPQNSRSDNVRRFVEENRIPPRRQNPVQSNPSPQTSSTPFSYPPSRRWPGV